MDPLEGKLQAHLGDKYVIQVELVGGGMSRVFVAEEVALSRRVVIKVLHPTLAATVSAARFQREILLAAGMNHPNIVPVLSAGEVDTLPYFIMPFVAGESLRARVMRGPLSVRETLAVMKDVARALAYAHSAGVVHRDIKPANILMTGSAAVVADFGVAKAVSAARDRGLTGGGTAITGVGISLGTPQYMAPEQAAADPNADHRVDLYALGTVAYEMLAGSPPFHGRTPQALLTAQLTELPMPLASRRYDVPVGVADLVMKCLEKNPEDRPRAAVDVVRILDSPEIIAGPVAETPRAVSSRRKRRLKSGVYVAAVAGLALAAAWWGLRPVLMAGGDSAAVPPLSTPAPSPVVGPAVSIVVDRAIGEASADIAEGIVAVLRPALSAAGSSVTSGPPTSTADSSGLVVGLTVQRQGARARATLRLGPAGSTTSLWSERFDFAVDDVFAAQDSMAARTVRAVQSATGR
jgi:serine/threonine-protein kinase